MRKMHGQTTLKFQQLSYPYKTMTEKLDIRIENKAERKRCALLCSAILTLIEKNKERVENVV